MKKYKVNEDCFCEGYLHEKNNYPREGLVERKLQKGDVVEFVEEWNNFYGSYFRVNKDGVTYDINPHKLEEYTKSGLEKPEQLKDEDIDLKELREVCQRHIDFVFGDNYHEDNDDDHFVYAKAMKAIYGNDIFDHISKKIEEHEESY